jgi:hypothetical protein
MAGSQPVAIASNQTAIPVSDNGGSLTVDGTVSVSGSVSVTGPLTDSQLRASAVPVSAASLPLPTGAATETTLSAINTKLPSLTNGSQPVQITALSYPSSTGNNTTTQLGSGATFTGTIEDIQLLQAAQVMVTCDQPYTIIVEQFIDAAGTKKVSKDSDYTFTRAAGVPTNENITLPGNYFRIKLTNTGGSATTTLQLATTFGIMNTTPYTTSNLGNYKTALNEVGGSALSLGQTTMVASLPVTIASNQSNLPMNLAQVNGASISLGQASSANSIPVSLPNDLTVGAAASIAAINTDLLTGNASGWYDAAAFHSVAIQIIGSAGISAGAIIFEHTNDTTAAASGNVWAVEEDTSLTPTPQIAAITIAASATRMFRAPVVARYVRVRVSTGFAGGTVQAVAVFSELPYSRMVQTVHQATAANLNATVTATNLSCNVAQVAGQVPLNPVANGSTNRALIAGIATAISNTDQNATAYAGTGRVNGTVVAAATGAGGAVITAEINLSALTLGAATQIVFILQESNGGTNFTDIWVSDPVAATGIIRVPPIPVGGRRRWCAHSVGGASTTVTATITTLELPPGSYPWTRQFRDSYAATAAFATVINSATQTASTFGAATALTATTQATSWSVVEGCKVITAHLTLGGAPTVTTQPVISLEVSNDLSNGFVPAGATMTAAGNGTYSVSVSNVSYRYARLRVTTAAAYSAGAYTISSVGLQGVN